MRKYLFPGSFDPFTVGHADLVERALHLCDQLVIAVGFNERKKGWIPVEERVQALKNLYAGEPRIEVVSYDTLTTDLAKRLDASAILRGVRTSADFLFEQTQADVNRRLTNIETVLLLSRPELACISSSTVRELANFGHSIEDFLPRGMQYNL
ncbi:MAG: pantetheine-phosphate adenylyltransferase [Bacteroidaceae bacterium]|nr:pantetheine-phosphate adenylyltransferase [Bacteroidaceae bacterium]MBQ4002631.1 pantetheine-phosphate adenylyltransferase [Bacteroidaceae bacterium]